MRRSMSTHVCEYSWSGAYGLDARKIAAIKTVFPMLKSLLKNGLLALSLFFGAASLWAVITHGPLAKAPLTPMNQVAGFAGSGRRVRVQGAIYGEPGLVSGDGRPLALQKVAIEYLERRLIAGHYSSTRRLIYSKIAPGRLWLGQGADRIEVKLPPLWNGDALLLQSETATVKDDRLVPPRIDALLSPSLRDWPALQSGYTFLAWSLKQGETVTVWSAVETQNGRPVLQLKPSDGLISARPFDEMARVSAHSDWMQIAIALLLLGVPLLILVNRWKHRRAKQVESAS